VAAPAATRSVRRVDAGIDRVWCSPKPE